MFPHSGTLCTQADIVSLVRPGAWRKISAVRGQGHRFPPGQVGWRALDDRDGAVASAGNDGRQGPENGCTYASALRRYAIACAIAAPAALVPRKALSITNPWMMPS